MESSDSSERDRTVELIISSSSSSDASSPPENNIGGGNGNNNNNNNKDEITPLLSRAEKTRFNIFSVSHSRNSKPREQVIKVHEPETLPLTQFILWIWSGSRYSGLLCMTVSSIIYFLMEVLSGALSVQPIPLYETAFARCAIILISSYLWLRKSGQSLFGPTNARNILVMRAVVGCLSLLSFIYCIQNLPLSQAIVISFTTPILASAAASFFFHEKLKISDIVGLACSFFGVLFIFQQRLGTEGTGSNEYPGGSHHVFAILIGLCSSLTGGISYCLIKAGAKASEHPVITVFWFGLLATPAAGLCMIAFEATMLPSLPSVFSMLVVGALAFSAEVFLARGLQLENTSKVANIQYIEAALSQLWGITLSSFSPSFGRLVGCFLIIISFGFTLYTGPDKELE